MYNIYIYIYKIHTYSHCKCALNHGTCMEHAMFDISRHYSFSKGVLFKTTVVCACRIPISFCCN